MLAKKSLPYISNPSNYREELQASKTQTKSKKLLLSEQRIAISKQRYLEVEAVFGNTKHNMGFKRFLLRRFDKVNVEIGLIATAHNLKKYSFVH